jgi:hypothetical protein
MVFFVGLFRTFFESPSKTTGLEGPGFLPTFFPWYRKKTFKNHKKINEKRKFTPT